MSDQTAVSGMCGGMFRTCSDPRFVCCDKCGMRRAPAVANIPHNGRPAVQGITSVIVNGKWVYP